jgi:hypothetical protein
MSASLQIPRYSREQFLALLVSKMVAQDYPPSMITRQMRPLVKGYCPPPGFKRNTLIEVLDLNTAEMAEFRRHFYGGD